ncbi:MAG: Protein-export membrane protein SecD [Candidatus Diapherotrites archaeon ADurb.Bin253]|nr:MAG: Protein-export membrane protein SecD [Candidatus Diapherotrites archaeon ADurb.Bin253]
MLDEARRKTSDSSIKSRIKNAFEIIMGAYLTLVAAMIPLYIVGGGLLKGFASTTIIGLTIGILVTRPAFGEMLKRMEK